MHLRRIILSILVGIFFPLLYAAAGGLLVDHVLPDGFDTTYIVGQPVPGLMFAPIALPAYFDAVLRSYDYFGYWLVFDNAWFRSTFFILFNFLFFSIAAYLLFKRLGWPGPAGTDGGPAQEPEIGSV